MTRENIIEAAVFGIVGGVCLYVTVTVLTDARAVGEERRRKAEAAKAEEALRRQAAVAEAEETLRHDWS